MHSTRCAIIIHGLIIVLCVETSLEDGAVNYCGSKMCAYTDVHTFCRYPPGPSPQCVGYIDARLSQDDKSRVLRRLNRRRSEVARGGRGLPAAADMLKLRWVEELSREAQRWADQCQPPSIVEHQDDCRDLYSITVGQCVSSVVGEAPGLRFESMVDMWPMQARLYKRFLDNVTQTVDKSRGYYGDYAQMFWSRTYMVGCGRSRFMIPWHGRERSVDRLVCNFAPRWPGTRRELWAPGEPASVCPARSRPDPHSPDLCSYHYTIDELYDEDNTMSLEEHLLLETVLEIERNSSLDYIGSMDELYLTKLAIATIQNPFLTSPANAIISVQKRSILKKVEIQNDTVKYTNTSYIQENAIRERTSKYRILKSKSHLLGRPKTYNIDDLNESDIMKKYNKERIKAERDKSYEDYSSGEVNEETSTETTYLPTNTLKESPKQNTAETDRQLQEAIDLMERKLAASAPVSTSGKVRRELRDLKHKFKNESTQNALPETVNDTDRGPMINMILKYIPYLKPFEKSIIGDSKANVNNAKVVSPCFILFIVLYF